MFLHVKMHFTGKVQEQAMAFGGWDRTIPISRSDWGLSVCKLLSSYDAGEGFCCCPCWLLVCAIIVFKYSNLCNTCPIFYLTTVFKHCHAVTWQQWTHFNPWTRQMNLILCISITDFIKCCCSYFFFVNTFLYLVCFTKLLLLFFKDNWILLRKKK